jgi:predicted metal-dependent peptidase
MGHGVDIIEKYVAKRTNISWTLLRQWVSRCSIGGYNWNRPSRRHGWRVEDVLLPNNRSKNACNGVILCDTSGSMGTEEMNEALRQIQKIISEYRNATITLVQCDRRIVEESIKTFSKYDFPLRSEHEWFGRGGTNMAPALNWVAEHRQQFDWCIMVSDMEWEVNWNPEEVPNTFIPTVYLAVNNEAVKPPHAQHHALSVKVAA